MTQARCLGPVAPHLEQGPASSDSSPLLDPEPRGGGWPCLPSASVVPSGPCNAGVPPPSSGSRWVMSFTGRASIPTFTEMVELHTFSHDVTEVCVPVPDTEMTPDTSVLNGGLMAPAPWLATA